jgi:hypothetical protein
MPLTIMMGMVLLVIAMAVVNVASLLLVRAAGRAQEFAVRYALGATSGQILRQLMAEGLLLGGCGAAIGLLLAPQALHVLIHGLSGGSPDGGLPFMPTLDWRVLVFTLGVTVLASLLFSLAPMAQFQNPRLAEAMKERGGSGGGLCRSGSACCCWWARDCLCERLRICGTWMRVSRQIICCRSIWIRCWRVILRRELRRWSSGRSMR